MFQSIARFVDFKPNRKLTKGDKSKITRYYKRIAKALERGYKPIKTRNDGRIAAAHRAQGIRGMPGLRVVLAKPSGAGFRTSIGKDGSIRAVNSKSGISKVTIAATFFDNEESDESNVQGQLEAARLTQDAKIALGHKPQRFAIAYWGGENAWAQLSFLPDALVVNFNQYAQARGFPADSVTFYWVKRSKNVLKVQQRLRDEKTIASQKRAQKRKNSDI